MDRDEKLYFDELSKKSLSEIKEIFQNLKHIGMSDEDIEKYAKQYKDFFESRLKATGYEHIDGKKISTFSEVSKDQVQTDLSQSVVSQHSSS